MLWRKDNASQKYDGSDDGSDDNEPLPSQKSDGSRTEVMTDTVTTLRSDQKREEENNNNVRHNAKVGNVIPLHFPRHWFEIISYLGAMKAT